MLWSLVIQTLTFRAAVVLADYVILAVVLQRPVEAGLITIIRHIFHTLMYWGHEVVWAQRRFGAVAIGLAASRRYTLQKAISFRVISLVADLLLLWLLTGDIRVSGVGALLIAIVNTIFFYHHDRWWEAWRAAHRGEPRCRRAGHFNREHARPDLLNESQQEQD